MVKSLVLVATRRCTQRCGYCPVVKDGWPDMSAATASAALGWYVDRLGGGRVKLFGGEPLLNPAVVRSVVEEVTREARLSSVTVCSTGSVLDDSWLDFLWAHPKAWLTVSIDGRPEDHRRYRIAAPGEPDGLAMLESLLPRLRLFPRLLVTQVIAPRNAATAAAGFRYLLGLGFRRINVLPASWVRWDGSQLEELRESLADIRALIEAEWSAGRPFYLRNLFVHEESPTFTSAAVVDCDGAIFPSDCVLSGLASRDRRALRCGDLETPPDAGMLSSRAALVPEVLSRAWTKEIRQSTALADAALDVFWRRLLRAYLERVRNRGPRTDSGARVARNSDLLLNGALMPGFGGSAGPEVWS